MPTIHPFRPWRYHQAGLRDGGPRPHDVTPLIAPPYDVLDAESKQRLLAQSDRNIAAIDLPHVPAKELGPASAYEGAAATLRKWTQDGTLTREALPAIYVYRQRFVNTAGREVARLGVCCCVDLVPFGPAPGGGVLPHEETFSGPKEDRLALMRATEAQLSPIFGLCPDDAGAAAEFARRIAASRGPDTRGTLTGAHAERVEHEVWTVDDAGLIRQYQEALQGQDVFIADGHHRYTTQLNYLQELASRGPVPPDHPARRCMFVLISMNDAGLVIWPTHRVLGGMPGYSFDRLLDAARGSMKITPFSGSIHDLYREVTSASAGAGSAPRVGLYDFASEGKKAAVATPLDTHPDPLAARFPDKPKAWRQLDVSWTQHAIVEDVCARQLASGATVKWAFPHTLEEVLAIGRGEETGAGGGQGFAQLAVLVRPTPLSAVRDVSRANVLMPQKSTFFYPKLATGLWINPLTEAVR